MEKAIIISIRKTKKNELLGKLKFSDGKTMEVKYAKIDESYNGKECDVLREGGQIVKIICDDKTIFEKKGGTSQKSVKNKKGNRNTASKYKAQNNNTENQSEEKYATAPYNFIPLNKTVLGVEIPQHFNKYYDDRYTGYIDCTLTTKTNLYIRDTCDNNKQKSKDNPDFYSPGGMLKIPGSSLRGMVRNLVEIVSFGKFTIFEDKLLFYRGLADNCVNFRKEYGRNMSSRINQGSATMFKFNAGYLKREGLEYYIIPAKLENGKQFSQIKKRDKSEEFIIERRADGKYLVVSGNMEGKKHDWLINEPNWNAEKINISSEDIHSYILDENRYKDDDEKKKECDKKDGDLLRLLKCSEEKIVPCFYVRWTDSKGRDRISFGHTGYFRLAYKKTIGDHIPQSLKSKDTIDMAESIFGKESSHASRLYFEDAVIIPGKNDVLLPRISPKILSGPKPTTFQHYLRQDYIDKEILRYYTRQNDKDKKILNHWNSDCEIRGYKLYWHRIDNNWREAEPINDKLHTIITPVKPNTKFSFRIRFENLTDIELGAVLFVLSLPQGHYHKLGMGKPYGLGSVEIIPSLYLTNRTERYKKLFSDKRWYLGIEKEDINRFKNAFEKFVLKGIGDEANGADNLWDVDRIKDLKIMLNWDNTKIKNWDEKTRYMSIDNKEFKERNKLPFPPDIIGQYY